MLDSKPIAQPYFIRPDGKERKSERELIAIAKKLVRSADLNRARESALVEYNLIRELEIAVFSLEGHIDRRNTEVRQLDLYLQAVRHER